MKRLYGIFICFFIWYVFAFLLKDIIPFPHQVIYYFIKYFPQGLDLHFFVSLKRLMIGLILGVIIGVHLGLLLGLHKLSNQLLSPIIYGFYPIPKAALLPILIILFGLGDFNKILLIILIVIFPIIIQVKDTVIGLPNEVFYIAKSLSLNKLQMYKEIIIPALLPNLLTSLRLGIGTSVSVLFLSESFATQNGGLGYYIQLNLSSNYIKMFVGIFALSFIGYLLFILVDILESKLCKWV
ncbi:MAG: transporter permease [Haloplasmataceae bacterium]|jgi:NitT/TauT family transport system permease protein|nr:transporter permease [Haloplasmataceae bacterium]